MQTCLSQFFFSFLFLLAKLTWRCLGLKNCPTECCHIWIQHTYRHTSECVCLCVCHFAHRHIGVLYRISILYEPVGNSNSKVHRLFFRLLPWWYQWSSSPLCWVQKAFQNGSFVFMQLLNHVHAGEPFHRRSCFAIYEKSWVSFDCFGCQAKSVHISSVWCHEQKQQHFGAELEKNNTTTVPLFPFYERVFTFERLLLCFVTFFCLALLFFLCLYLKGIWSPAGSQKFSDMFFYAGKSKSSDWGGKCYKVLPYLIFFFVFCFVFKVIYAGTFFLFLTVLLPCSSSKKVKNKRTLRVVTFRSLLKVGTSVIFFPAIFFPPEL